MEEEQQQMLLETEREQQEKSQQIAIQRLAVVSAVYNRCLSALNVTVVDVSKFPSVSKKVQYSCILYRIE